MKQRLPHRTIRHGRLRVSKMPVGVRTSYTGVLIATQNGLRLMKPILCSVVAERTAREATEGSQLAYSLCEACLDGFTRAAEECSCVAEISLSTRQKLQLTSLHHMEGISWLSYKRRPKSHCEQPRSKVEAPSCTNLLVLVSRNCCYTKSRPAPSINQPLIFRLQLTYLH